MSQGPNFYIRNVLTIDATVQAFCTNYVGPSPVVLAGRIVRHAPGFNLLLGTKRLVVLADLYDGNGGAIVAVGQNGAYGGVHGAGGSSPSPPWDIHGRPLGAGGEGGSGGAGAAAGPGGQVTVLCRRSVNVEVDARGGWGGPGGDGGTGGRGVDGFNTADSTTIGPDGEIIVVPGESVAGTPGGIGGAGGTGGAGGAGGSVRFISVMDDTYTTFNVSGGGGGAGGAGGSPGLDGRFAVDAAVEGQVGAEGMLGPDGTLTHKNVSEDSYRDVLRAEVATLGCSRDWATFRLATGNFFYHRYNPRVPDRVHYGRLAAAEFERCLELEPGHIEATRLQQQLVGFQETVPGTNVVVTKGGGNNALGLPPDLDVLPQFDQYMRAFTSFGALTLQFLTMGTGAVLTDLQMEKLREFVGLQGLQAESARESIRDDLRIAVGEQHYATDDVTYAQQQLNQASQAIQAAMDDMRHQTIEHDSIVGTVASIGTAVVAIVAAIPTMGASLVALVPSIVALANTVLSNAEPLVASLMSVDTTDLQTVSNAYATAGATNPLGTHSIVNFVSLVKKLSAGKTQANAAHVALVTRGVEQTHALLLARQRLALAGQRVSATAARLERAATVVAVAEQLQISLTNDASTVRRAGMLAIQTAKSKVNALLSLAFRAQRSVEIYTLEDQGQHLLLDAGLLSPDDEDAYMRGEFGSAHLVGLLQDSWASLLAPLSIQDAYTSFFDRPLDKDTHRLRFGAGPERDALLSGHRFTFRVEPAHLPSDHFETKVQSVRVAFVGAVSGDGAVSCEVRHGGKYEQRLRNGTTAVQLLKPTVSTRIAKTVPLSAGDGDVFEPPLTAPQALACWGRGVGGEWELRIPDSQFAANSLDLSSVTSIQVWITYQFTR